MIIALNSLYTEPKYYLKISFKLTKLIETSINENFGNVIKDKFENDYTLSMFNTTGKKIKEINILGPDIDNRKKIISWNLCFPYKKISKSKDVNNEYINSFIDPIYFLNRIAAPALKKGSKQ